MKHHRLKTEPNYFKDIVVNAKKFELRKNDRDFQIGDMVTLREWHDGYYSGFEKTITIKYILKDCPEYGLQDGYCIFGW